MSIRWLDGFEQEAISQFSERYDILGPEPKPYSIEKGRFSGLSVRFFGKGFVTPALASHHTYIVGFALKNTITKPYKLFEVRQDDNAQLALHLDPQTGFLSVMRDDYCLATGSISMRRGDWYFIEARFFIDRNYGSVEVRINKRKDMEVSVVDTQPVDGKRANKFAFLRPDDDPGYFFIDDFYVLVPFTQNSIESNLDFLGDWKLEASVKSIQSRNSDAIRQATAIS